MTTASCEPIPGPCSFTFLDLEKPGVAPFTTTETITAGTITIDTLNTTGMTGRFSADVLVRQQGTALGSVRFKSGRFSVPRPLEL